MTNFSLCLNGTWKCACIGHNEQLNKKLVIHSAEDVAAAGLDVIDATVPGNFELDLYNAGKIDDPYFADNVYSMQDFENQHIFYWRDFEYRGDSTKENVIIFEGIDTFAEIYINGQLIGKTDNMLIEHKFEVTDALLSGKNDIFVHILPAAVAEREYQNPVGSNYMKYNAGSMYVRKAPHMYGWDIMPRILSAGIWRDVGIQQLQPDRIDEVYITTNSVDMINGNASVTVAFNLTLSGDLYRDYEVCVKGVCGDSTFEGTTRIFNNSGEIRIYPQNCKFWWPKGLGEPNMYDVTVSLTYKGKEVAQKQIRYGIRQIKLINTGVTDCEGGGKFQFNVNWKDVFMLGTNWVPADAFHSNDVNRLPRMLELLDDVGCNMVRCWGGNVYENDMFYDFCDSHGIMVWQDFSMACAIYPMDNTFFDIMRREITAVVKRLRNHSCIALWAGDNECDLSIAGGWQGIKRNPNEVNIITRKVIPEILSMHDYIRPYLPSSPYVSNEAYEKGIKYLTEDHLWGPRDYFRSNYYNNSLCHFVSEIGYHGMVSPDSVKKFISADKIWPYKDNQQWLAHATTSERGANVPYSYRIELMAKQIRELFGTVPDNYEDFALASQISQAEAKKHFIELFRGQKWRRTGIIWWNLIDGWPQFSDAVVDYYFTKKLAYSYIKTAQQPLLLMFGTPSNWRLPLIVSNNSSKNLEIEYQVTDLKTDKVVKKWHTAVGPDISCEIDSLAYSKSIKTIYLIEWTVDGKHYKNHYLCGEPTFDFDEYVALIKKAGLLCTEGFGF